MMRCAAFALLILGASATDGANPIRKVVTLMQDMQKEIEAEGAKDKELFDKFMCFCTGNTGDLEKKIADGQAKITDSEGKLKADTAEKAQLELDIVQHKEDKAAAENDLSKASSLRSKENAEAEASIADSKKNIAAMASAIPALEKGMGAASLVQLPGVVARIKQLAETSADLTDFDRKAVTSFIEQGGDYAPASGQIVGILKAMKDDMESELKQATTDEETAAKGFADLKAAKETEAAAAAEAIRTKTARSGELAVSNVQTADDIDDTGKEVADNQKFLANLLKACPGQEKAFQERAKARADEVSAISEAIGILNDDDALDVFKKAVPAALLQEGEQGVRRYGFLQGKAQVATTAARVQKVQAILAQLAKGKTHSARFAVALFNTRSRLRMAGRSGATGDFGNITGMVDDMIVIEGEEQKTDDSDKPWCNGEFEKGDRETKEEKGEISHLEAEMEEEQEMLDALAEEVKGLTESIADLDKKVAEATETRKDEHAEYQETMTLTQTAIELIGKAKNRLQKFYNPTLYKAPPVRKEMTMEEKILAGASALAQIHSHHEAKQPVMPEVGTYEKSSQKSGGVMALMDMIVKDLENTVKDTEYGEKSAQEDYVELMEDCQASRAQYSKSLTDKEAAKAEVLEKKASAKEKELNDFKDLDNIGKYVGQLHVKCDFILENYDVRKEARAAEVEGLKNAKAVLAGAHM